MTYAFITAAEAAATIHHGDTVGIGGFSSVGTPKAVPEALAAYAEAQHAQGKEFKVGLITGGATGCQVDSALVKAHAVSFRTPFQSNKDMRESINQHEVQYFDLHLSQIGQDVRYGFLGENPRSHRRNFRPDGRRRNHPEHFRRYLAYPAPGGRTGYHRA